MVSCPVRGLLPLLHLVARGRAEAMQERGSRCLAVRVFTILRCALQQTGGAQLSLKLVSLERLCPQLGLSPPRLVLLNLNGRWRIRSEKIEPAVPFTRHFLRTIETR